MQTFHELREKITARNLEDQIAALKEAAIIVQQFVRSALAAMSEEPEANYKFLLSERVAQFGNILMGEMITQFRKPELDDATRNLLAVLIAHLRSAESIPHLEAIVTAGPIVDVPMSAKVLLDCDQAKGISAILTRLRSEIDPAAIEALLGLLVDAGAYISEPLLRRLREGPQTWGISFLLAKYKSNDSA